MQSKHQVLHVIPPVSSCVSMFFNCLSVWLLLRGESGPRPSKRPPGSSSRSTTPVWAVTSTPTRGCARRSPSSPASLCGTKLQGKWNCTAETCNSLLSASTDGPITLIDLSRTSDCVCLSQAGSPLSVDLRFDGDLIVLFCSRIKPGSEESCSLMDHSEVDLLTCFVTEACAHFLKAIRRVVLLIIRR